jgi:uncharacterized protein (DUF1015 family)
MPQLRPFAGIRYSSADEIAYLVCPPYDVIADEEQRRLHALHPNNAIRLELAEPQPGPNKYAHVGDTFRTWLEEGVLIADTPPSLYVYRQDFLNEAGRPRQVTGVIGALELEPFGERSGVLPHERTMPGPKEDRLALMRACPANISPIYAIYRGGGSLRSLYDSLDELPPVYRLIDESKVRHRLWRITGSAEIAALTDAIRSGPLVLADGHHRYETALAFHEESRDRPGDHGSIMCFCVDADSEEIVVLPYNRVLRAEVQSTSVRPRLEESFGARRTTENDVVSDATGHLFTVVLSDTTLIASVSDAQVVAATGERHPAWRALDVVALHEVLIPQVFGERIELLFSKDSEEVEDLVTQEGWTAGFLLRALNASQIVDVAGSGERMPQKASYFWPKALTGLVFHSLQ